MDPYQVLGVSKSASAEEIKKAYRKLAHQHHPDKKHGNEAKFKEINEAYQILGDAEKKARYDQFGHAGAQGGFGGGQGGGQYQDMNFDFGGMGGGFESIFDMFSGAGMSGSQRRADKGEDLYLEISVSSKDLGKRKVYEFESFVACADCKGEGIEPGSKRITCTDCKGQGRVRQAVRTPFGTFAQVGVCPKCQGEGSVPENIYKHCSGTGRRKGKRTIEIHIPETLEGEYPIAFPAQGNAGPEGVRSGDLLITLKVK
jgi:molecular chaperone DnaJ